MQLGRGIRLSLGLERIQHKAIWVVHLVGREHVGYLRLHLYGHLWRVQHALRTSEIRV